MVKVELMSSLTYQVEKVILISSPSFQLSSFLISLKILSL